MTTPDLPPLPKLSLLCRFMPDDYRYGDVLGFTADQMRAYGDARAAAAVLAERERCAKIAEQVTIQGQHTLVGQMCAAAIRAEPKEQQK
jgi:hypothetical protein